MCKELCNFFIYQRNFFYGRSSADTIVKNCEKIQECLNYTTKEQKVVHVIILNYSGSNQNGNNEDKYTLNNRKCISKSGNLLGIAKYNLEVFSPKMRGLVILSCKSLPYFFTQTK